MWITKKKFEELSAAFTCLSRRVQAIECGASRMGHSLYPSFYQNFNDTTGPALMMRCSRCGEIVEKLISAMTPAEKEFYARFIPQEKKQ